MANNQVRVNRALLPILSRRLARIDLREHEDKLLLLLALVISAAVGLVVVAFVTVTETMGKVLLNAGPQQRFFGPLLGSLVAGWMLFRFFPDARGSGIPQTRVALVLNNGVISLRTIIGKFICSSITLGSGVALGREGPSVHIGAGIASVAGRRLGLRPEHIRALIPVGTAAAVAAAFNTPLAAVLFTLEEIMADLHARVLGTVVIGAATSWIILRLILGDEPLFHVPAYQLVHPLEFVLYALLGVTGGLVSVVFVALLLRIRKQFLKTPSRWQPFAPAVGGLVVGLMALAVPGVLGVGYNLVSGALNGQLTLKMLLLLLVLKLIATATSYSSGNAGGIFGPSLFIGAMLGGAFGELAHMLMPDHTGNAGAYALVGMGAAFAGIIRTPMTSVIMIFELTRDYTIIVPLMIANLCSYFLAKRLQPQAIYEALSHQDGILMPSAEHRLEPLTVETAMRRQPQPTDRPEGFLIHPDDPLDTALQRLGSSGLNEVPVVSRVGAKQIGTLTVENAIEAYQRLSLPATSESGEDQESAVAQSWLPAAAAVAVAAVLLVSGLVVWQRSHNLSLGRDAYRNGERFLAEGRVDEAVAVLRSGLARVPQDNKTREALGMALVRSGNYAEADSYLSAVAKAEPRNAPVQRGLAQIAQARNDDQQAMRLLKQSLAMEWPAGDEPERRAAQIDYATLLLTSGRKNEGYAALLSIITQRGDDLAISKQAADLIQRHGSPEQREAAYSALVAHFPADSSLWSALGDARLAQDKESAALDAYRRAAAINSSDASALKSVRVVEDVLALDPMRRGLSVRQRAQRWDEVLKRIAAEASSCGSNPAVAKAKPLLQKPATSLEMSDQKMEAALAIWKGADSQCKQDPVMIHILSKLTG